ncbi:MAG: ATP-binding protein [Bacteroidia bacterium]
MFFKEVAGHKNVIEKLIKSAKNNRVSHTQLFSGKSGYEHLKLAFAYAQYINCLNPNDNDSCGNCSSCKKYLKLQHPDLHIAFPTTSGLGGASDFVQDFKDYFLTKQYFTEQEWAYKLSSDSSKQLKLRADDIITLKRQLSYKAYEAKYKVQILWLPEYLEKEGNKLLKILEEPNQDTVFLLVTNNIDDILPTILSRTQIIKVPRLSDETLAKFLIEKYKSNENVAYDVARIAEGNTGYAIELLNEDNTEYFENFSNWMRACYSQKADEIINWIEKFPGGREYNKSFLRYSMQMFRYAFILKYVGSEMSKIKESEKAFLENFTKVINRQSYIPIVQMIDQVIYHIERNSNQKITFFHLSLYIGTQIKNNLKAA